MVLRRLGIVESAERSRSFVDCAVAFAACVVAAAAGFVAVAVAVAVAVRCIVGSRRSAAHVESHRELLARCRCRQGRALAHYVAAEADFVALAQYELVAEDEQEVVAPLIGVFAYKGRLKAHMRA